MCQRVAARPPADPARAGHARPRPDGITCAPLLGLTTVVIICAIFALAVGLFQGSFTETVPVTVISQRAGLVMNPDAKVKMRGVQVGKVDSIESLPNGQAAIHLAMDPSQLHFIPGNVLVDIASSTVFGAKSVELVPPADPSAQRLHGGQTLQGKHVMVEINTVFQQLVSVLAHIDPPKLNETLGALAQAFSGRGPQLGQSLSDLDSFLARLEPSLPALSHDLAVLPAVSNAYADAAPDLVKTAANATRISKTIVDEQHNLDALLISAIGLADIGNDVLSTNRKPLTDVLHLLVPTTDLTNEYHEVFTCGFGGLVQHSARSAVVGTEHQHIGEPHLGRRTLSVSDELAQGCGDGRPAVHGSAERCRSTRIRSNSSPISAPTRWGTETHSC